MRYTCLALLTLAAQPALAQMPENLVRAEILPGWRDGAQHHAGLRLSLAPGWKTYWRAPGDGGVPPRFDWRGSENIRSISVAYPVPEVVETNGLRSIVYHDQVILPLTIRPDAGGAMRIKGTVEVGICEEICVPYSVTIDAALPERGAVDAALEAAIADRPMTPTEAGVGVVECQFQPLSDGMQIAARIALPQFSRDEVAVIELSDPAVWVSEPDLARKGGTITLLADAVPPSAEPFFLARDSVRITVIGEGQAVEINGCG